jgi:uncharacterized membrane protein
VASLRGETPERTPERGQGSVQLNRLTRETVFAVSADTRRALALSAFLGSAGAMHFVVPKFYDAMIPEPLPGSPRTWTIGSGVAALMFAAWLPGNIKMALDARKSDSAAFRAGTILRLPLQLPLITWALKVRRGAG